MKTEFSFNKDQFEKITEMWENTNEHLGIITEQIKEIQEDGISINFNKEPMDLIVDLHGVEIAINRISDALRG